MTTDPLSSSLYKLHQTPATGERPDYRSSTGGGILLSCCGSAAAHRRRLAKLLVDFPAR